MLTHCIKNIENYKVYHIIIIFTLSFILILFNGFYHIRNEIISIANQNRLLIAKDIDYTISSWVSERINNLESSVKYLAKDSLFEDEEKLKTFSETFLQDNAYFDAIQILIPERYFYVNSTKFHDYRDNPVYVDAKSKIEPLKTTWFMDTVEKKRTTIHGMPIHGYLLEKTLNICTPILQQERVKGVFCGIFKASSLFEKIEKLKIPQNASYFISDNKGNILTSIVTRDTAFQESLKTLFSNTIDVNTNEPQKIFIENDVITLSKFKQFNWYIGIVMDKEDIVKEHRQRITTHAIWLLFWFILLLIIVNSAHEFLRRRMEQKQKEYEYMLAHRSRISEIGELISGINHQLRQPINTTALIVSNTLDLSERHLLDKTTLEANLQLCQQSIHLMDKTIDLFRNFYRCNESVTEFSLLDCIKSVLHINYIELTKNNINIQINEKSLENIYVTSVENFIQQILLVLIQNAKDSLAMLDTSKSKVTVPKQIHICTSQQDDIITIDVSDWGGGVSKEVQETLFSEFKTSKKYKGSGLGLFFARKLAKEKLLGDLRLYHAASPTTFRLTFKRYLTKRK